MFVSGLSLSSSGGRLLLAVTEVTVSEVKPAVVRTPRLVGLHLHLHLHLGLRISTSIRIA
jgi:hypothetical protein